MSRWRRIVGWVGLISLSLPLLGACGQTGRTPAEHRRRPSDGRHLDSGRPHLSSHTVTLRPPEQQVRSKPPSMPESSSPRATTLPPIAASTLVATIKAVGAPGSQTPGGPPTQEVPGRWLGAGSELPVLAQEVGWVEVRLAQRPNESVAWVPADDVTLATDTFHIVVDLATTQLQLFNRAQLVTTFPAGVGMPADPTPTGHFFVALFAQSPSPWLRTVRDRHLRTQHSHQRLGRIRRRPDRASTARWAPTPLLERPAPGYPTVASASMPTISPNCGTCRPAHP